MKNLMLITSLPISLTARKDYEDEGFFSKKIYCISS